MTSQRNDMPFTYMLNLLILCTLALGLFSLLIYNISNKQDGPAVFAMTHQVPLLLIVGTGICVIRPMADHPDMDSSDVTDAVRGVSVLTRISIPLVATVALIASHLYPDAFPSIYTSTVQIITQSVIAIVLLAVGVIIPKMRA